MTRPTVALRRAILLGLGLGLASASCSKDDQMSDDQSTTPWRWPPAHTPRVRTSGVSPASMHAIASRATSSGVRGTFGFRSGGVTPLIAASSMTGVSLGMGLQLPIALGRDPYRIAKPIPRRR